jgi:hypothetical protein
VIELDAVELVLEGMHGVAVGLHLVVVATRVLHDLVNHELRVSLNVKVFDACFDGNSEAAEEGLVLCHVVGHEKMQACLICSPRGEMKSRPVPAPIFITDPSK